MKLALRTFTLLLLVLLPLRAGAQQWRTDRYDSRWLPITDKEMARQVKAFAQDAVSLYRLYDRARYQHKDQAYFGALQQLKREQSMNGIVLATYCAVLMDANQLYGFGQYRFKVDVKEGNPQVIERNLALAEELEPKLWLNSLTAADLAFFTNGDQLEGAEKAVVLCRQAVKLAPDVSFTHERLGYWLGNLARERKTSKRDAVSAYQKAQKLRPINSDASFLLLNVYRYYEPNKVQAQKAAQAVLATIPPSVTLDQKMKTFLIKQGISLPKPR